MKECAVTRWSFGSTKVMSVCLFEFTSFSCMAQNEKPQQLPSTQKQKWPLLSLCIWVDHVPSLGNGVGVEIKFVLHFKHGWFKQQTKTCKEAITLRATTWTRARRCHSRQVCGKPFSQNCQPETMCYCNHGVSLLVKPTESSEMKNNWTCPDCLWFLYQMSCFKHLNSNPWFCLTTVYQVCLPLFVGNPTHTCLTSFSHPILSRNPATQQQPLARIRW